MPYSFEKCCFDSQDLGVVKDCNRTSCILNRSHNLKLLYHRNNDESFYCLNGKDLGEYWHCVQNDQQTLCPNKCKKYAVCKEFS